MPTDPVQGSAAHEALSELDTAIWYADNGAAEKGWPWVVSARAKLRGRESTVSDAAAVRACSGCGEVYDYALGNLVVACQRLPGHEGPHRWTGDDMMPNRVTLDWEAVSGT